MFNRTIGLRVVKTHAEPEPTPEEVQASMEELFDIVGQLAHNAGRGIIKLVVGYIALDTARKVVIGRYGK